MKISIAKLKMATKGELIAAINLVEEELFNQMYYVSYARYKELDDYKKEIEAELAKR